MKCCTSKSETASCTTDLSALRWALSSSSSPILASCPRHRSFIVRSASCSVFRLASEKSVVEAMSLLIHGVGGTEQTLPLFLPLSFHLTLSQCRMSLLTDSFVCYRENLICLFASEVNHSPAAGTPCYSSIRPCEVSCNNTVRNLNDIFRATPIIFRFMSELQCKQKISF